MTAARVTAKLRKAARAEAEQLPIYRPEFEFRIRWADSYDGLFGGRGEETAIDELIHRSVRHGRVLLQSGGGTGKSSILHRLYKRLSSDRRSLPILIDMRLHPIRRQSQMPTDDIDALLSSAIPSTTEEQLSIAASKGRVVVLVDGLNEVPKNLGNAILRELDALAARNPKAGVIVADRLVRRPVSGRWKLATIAPLEGASGLDSIAFWRDLAPTTLPAERGRLPLHDRYLGKHCSLTSNEIDAVAGAALLAYRTEQSRLFPLDDFIAGVGQPVGERLTVAGVLEQHGRLASFTHHLHHDLLAARAFAADTNLWNHSGFDDLTFTASSFDALEAVAEATAGRELTDRLVLAVYDWNPYAAAYVLSRGGAGQVSDALRVAITAMLAERRFDLIQATVTDAEDALHLLGDTVPLVFRTAKDRASLIAAVDEHLRGSASAASWLDLFTRSEDSPLPEDALDALEDASGTENSLLGWTVANVARRMQLSPDQLDRLRADAASNPNVTVRWRATHSLGGHPAVENFATLSGVIRRRDEDHWVVRGALRAIIEIAATAHDQLRTAVLHDLSELLRERADTEPDDLLVRSFARFAELHRPPRGWDQLLLPIAEDLWASAQTSDQQERWENLALTLKTAQHLRGA